MVSRIPLEGVAVPVDMLACPRGVEARREAARPTGAGRALR
jgi:hypothetical protein